MTARSVATTDTLETFRTTFNSLSSTDIGDPASLTTTATSIVGAINEINTSVLSTGFKIADDTSSVTETIAIGDVLRISNGSNITATVSATDTVTVALNSTITGLTSVSATTGTFTNLTVGGVSVATNAFAIAQAVALG